MDIACVYLKYFNRMFMKQSCDQAKEKRSSGWLNSPHSYLHYIVSVYPIMFFLPLRNKFITYWNQTIYHTTEPTFCDYIGIIIGPLYFCWVSYNFQFAPLIKHSFKKPLAITIVKTNQLEKLCKSRESFLARVRTKTTPVIYVVSFNINILRFS